MKRKILLIFTILIIISVTTTGIISLHLTRQNYIDELSTHMLNYGKLIALNLEGSEAPDFQGLARSYAEKIDGRVTFIDEGGVVVGDSDASLDRLDNHGDRPEILDAYEGEVGTAIRYSDTLKSDLYYVAYPTAVDGGSIIIRISKSMSDIEGYLGKLLKNYVFALLVGTAFALFFGLRLEKIIIKPINEMISRTREISAGRFGEQVYTDNTPEMRHLAENFNEMSAELSLRIEEIKSSNSSLRATLDSMVNGIIAVDKQRQVLFMNPVAEKIFHLKGREVKGKKLAEIFRNSEVLELIEDYFTPHQEQLLEKEIEYGNRYFVITINPITGHRENLDKYGVVISIQDITELKKLENMRKDFVANVSHELKTPLTSIRGFIETLKSGNITDKETEERFLSIVEIESIRLTDLIEDLLLLSDIEKHGLVDSEKIMVKSTIADVYEIMDIKARDHGIALSLIDEIPEEASILGNNTWFKQVLINLLDNGIKYNKDQGSLTLEARVVKDQIRIIIEDTGIGIPEEHFDRLFERFYRVDRSRSKEVGGTGLGLAIVKHVLRNLGGTIDLKSEVNVGTTFLITIPLNTAT